MPIINGDIIFPKYIPNLNHKKFKGFNIFEFMAPRNKNSVAIINDQTLNSSEYIIGQIPIKKNKAAKTKPKDLLLGNLIFSINNKIFYFLIVIYSFNKENFLS